VIPTGDTLGLASAKAEYVAGLSSSNSSAFWLNLGLPRLEIEGVRFRSPGHGTTDAISGQVCVLPETTFTPAVAVGARDLSNSLDHKNALYDGRALYVAVSKSLPMPKSFTGIRNVKLHGGIGTGSLNGLFVGAEGTLPMNLIVAGEFDSQKLNASVAYQVIPGLRFHLSEIRGQGYYGISFVVPKF